MDPLVTAVLAAAALAAGLALGSRAARRRTGDRGDTAVPATSPAVGAPAGTPADAVAAGGTLSQGIPGTLSASGIGRDAETLVDLVGIGALLVDASLLVLAANDVAARLLGKRPGSLAGRSAMEAFTDHRIEEIVRTAMADGAAVGEVTVRIPAAPTILVRAQRIERGAAWVALEDVSELRRLQSIRTEFIDNVSHELRTPLTNVSLLAETLEMEADRLPDRTADRIHKIRIETDHLVTMVNELLDLSRIESGSARLVIEDVHLDRLARATVDRVALFAERQGIRVSVVAPPTVPTVRGDGERLGQALLNLLHNAVKFSPAGSEVVVRVEPAESEITAAIEDQGPGIPRSALPRVFERFYKADRARTRTRGGTGLGLSIARHIVEAHGGRIWVESVEGRGSTFAFAIPMAGPELGATPGA